MVFILKLQKFNVCWFLSRTPSRSSPHYSETLPSLKVTLSPLSHLLTNISKGLYIFLSPCPTVCPLSLSASTSGRMISLLSKGTWKMEVVEELKEGRTGVSFKHHQGDVMLESHLINICFDEVSVWEVRSALSIFAPGL
ncbi:hypothetical protein AMECASPLE_010759 [Ameca splendens]|uniref:Uncharacterized protein n=1 Tax=Ameca splendens TaxID=208324 RepID=A0ABV0YMN1_9TELE